MKKACISSHQLKALAIDLDGVVYFGNTAAPGAATAVEGFRHIGLKVFFITNNSDKNREEITSKLNTLGVRCSLEEVVTSGYATVLFVKKLKPRRPVLVIGSDSLQEEFKKAGVAVTSDTRSNIVVVGLDRNYTYSKIAAGLQALRHGARFIACNVDANFPIKNGRLLPGCGAMVAAIEVAAGKKADVIIGKPSTYMLEMICRINALKPEDILVVGDGVNSDIAMAARFGSPAILITRKKISAVPTARSLVEVSKIICTKMKRERDIEH